MASLSLHDILIAWRDGRIDYRQAMDLAQIDTLGELYTAAELSGVRLRSEPTEEELRQAEIVAGLIRDHVRRQAA